MKEQFQRSIVAAMKPNKARIWQNKIREDIWNIIENGTKSWTMIKRSTSTSLEEIQWSLFQIRKGQIVKPTSSKVIKMIRILIKIYNIQLLKNQKQIIVNIHLLFCQSLIRKVTWEISKTKELKIESGEVLQLNQWQKMNWWILQTN